MEEFSSFVGTLAYLVQLRITIGLGHDTEPALHLRHRKVHKVQMGTTNATRTVGQAVAQPGVVSRVVNSQPVVVTEGP